jgi:hypothetical protein
MRLAMTRTHRLTGAAGLAILTLAGVPVGAATGPDAIKALIGNTMVGHPPRVEPFYAFFRPDGTVTSRQGETTLRQARWAYEGNELCMTGPDPKNPGRKECYELDIDGGHGALKSRQETIPFEILQGNPKNL